MKELLDLPAERDLPPARVARMRANLVTAMSRPRARPVRLRLAVPATAAVAAVVAGGVLLAMPGNQDGEQLLAMGPDELSPTARRAAEQCLAWNGSREPAPAMSDLAVAAQRGHRTQVLFLTGSGYLECDVSTPPGGEPHGGLSSASEWPHGGLLPGPVDQLGLGFAEDDGFLGFKEDNSGEVAMAGRVSARVHRLVLEHGNGHTTTARLANGVFGLISDGDDVRLDAAELVSYDASGREIDRRPLFPFPISDEFDRCYTDPSGAVIYGQPGPDCRPAEHWTRR